MSPWQSARQIAYLLRSKVWADSPGAHLLTKCIVTSIDPPKLIGEISMPFATVNRVETIYDEENLELVKSASFRVAVIAEVSADNYGQGVLVGANVGQQGSSGGKGLEELVQALIASLHPEQIPGLLCVCGKPEVAQVKLENQVNIGVATFTVSVMNLSATPSYDPVYRLKATNGSGQVTLSWALPPTRFDTLAPIVRRSGAGGSAPATPSSGTGVSVSPGDTSVTVTGLSGTYQFSVFMSYDETHGTPVTADRYSDAVSVSGVAS